MAESGNYTSVDLSISILAWNTRDFLKACLESIHRSTCRIRFEIIVVDNGSQDGAAEMVRREFPTVRLIRNETNLGFTAANNQAIRQSRGRYILLLNSDTEVQDGCLDLLVEQMDRADDVGAAAPRMFYPDGKPYPSIHPRYPDPLCCLSERSILTELFPGSTWVEKFRRRYFFIDESDYARDRDIAWGLGACLMVRRAAIDQVGLLDEKFFAFFEEIDWCLRMTQAGWKIRYYHQPVVHHHTAGSLRQDYDRITIIWHASRFYFYRKHYSIAAALSLKLIVASGVAVRLIKLVGRWLVGRGEARAEARRGLATYRRIFLMSLLHPWYSPNLR